MLGAVIVHHGDPGLAARALESVLASRGMEILAAVVDHGPGPGADLERRARAAGALYVRPEANRGFAAGLNRGLEALRARGGAELYLFLNHDAVLDPPCAATLARRFAEDPELGIAGPAVLYRDDPGLVWNAGSEIDWPRARPRSLFHRRPRLELPQEPYPVGFVCGCTLMARAKLLELLGPLPEEYFLFFEDAELCYRARQAGFRVMVDPGARALHQPGSAVSALPALAAFLRTRNRLLFSRRWAPPGPAPRLARGRFALASLLGGGPRRRGALDGLRGKSGPPPEDLPGSPAKGR